MTNIKPNKERVEQLNQEYINADIDRLNKQFYNSFDTTYFRQKSLYLAALLAKPDTIHNILTQGVAFKNLKLQVDKGEVEELSNDWLTRNIKAEIAVTYFHAVETLFRLIFAHALASDCPWFELLVNNDFKKFKRDVKKFQEHKYFNNVSHREGLSILFFNKKARPNNIDKDKWEKNLDNLSEFLDYFASELGNSNVYNSFKHGLAVFNEEFGFNLSEVIKVNKDDVFLILSYEKDEEAPEYKRLYREYVFTKWESKFALTYQLTSILNNLITVGKTKFVTKKGNYTLGMYDQFDLGVLIKNKGESIIPTSVKESSFSFKDKRK